MAIRSTRVTAFVGALLLTVTACGGATEPTKMTGVQQTSSSGYEVMFEVDGNATVDIWWGATAGPGDIMTTEDMNTAAAVALPWSADIVVSGRSVTQLVVLPHLYREGDAAPFTCRILVDGAVDSEAMGQDQWGCSVSSVIP